MKYQKNTSIKIKLSESEADNLKTALNKIIAIKIGFNQNEFSEKELRSMKDLSKALGGSSVKTNKSKS